jgi:hypothetical protein
MALSTAQKARIRYYLGYSDVSQGGSPNRLELAMQDITSDAQTIVVEILAAIATVETQLTTAGTRAGIVSVDNGGVVWSSDGLSPLRALANEGRRQVGRLSSMFGVMPHGDVFGSSAPSSGPMGRG